MQKVDCVEWEVRVEWEVGDRGDEMEFCVWKSGGVDCLMFFY
jgi:hypothetical protein